MHDANPGSTEVGLAYWEKARQHWTSKLLLQQKGEEDFPRSTVTLGDELPSTALRQPLLRATLVTVNKGHMLIWGQCVTSTAVLGYLVTINQVTAMTYMSTAWTLQLVSHFAPPAFHPASAPTLQLPCQYEHRQQPLYERQHTTAPAIIARLTPGHGAV